MGPFSPRPVGLAPPRDLVGLRRKQRGRDPGSTCASCTATFGRRTRAQSIWRTPKSSWAKVVF